MKQALIAVLVLAVSSGGLPAADSPPRGPEAARLVDPRAVPGRDVLEEDALCAEILKLGPAAVQEICGRVLPPGEGDDTRARFAVNGLAVYVMRPGPRPSGPSSSGPSSPPWPGTTRTSPRSSSPRSSAARRSRSGPWPGISSTRRWPGRPPRRS